MKIVQFFILISIFIFPHSVNSLEIELVDNMSFDVVVGGSKNIVIIDPSTNSAGALFFRVKGDAKQKIQVAVLESSYQMRNASTGREVKLNKFKYGCALNKRGRVRLDSVGDSGLLCIGAKAIVKSSSKTGLFQAVITVEVDYL